MSNTLFSTKAQTLKRLMVAWVLLCAPLLAQEQDSYPVQEISSPASTASERVPATATDSASTKPGTPAVGRGEANGLSQPFRLESREHKFWDRKNILLHSAAAAAAAADFWTTRRAISRGGRELSPLARPFAGGSAAFAAYKAGSWGTYLGLSYLFHRKGWHRLEHIMPAVEIATDGAAVGFNLRGAF